MPLPFNPFFSARRLSSPLFFNILFTRLEEQPSGGGRGIGTGEVEEEEEEAEGKRGRLEY